MAARIKAPVLASVACAAALVPLALAIYALGPAEHLDAALLVRTSAHVGPAGAQLAEAIARLADPLPLLLMTAVVCMLAVGWGRRREAVAAFAVVAGANITTQVLKVVLAHPRYQPYPGHAAVWPTAFPSGHTTAAVSIAIALALAAPERLRPFAAALGASFAAAVAFSVIALEWHLPSDVLGGTLVAASWGFAALAALRLRRSPGSPRQSGGRSGFRPPVASPSR